MLGIQVLKLRQKEILCKLFLYFASPDKTGLLKYVHIH